MLRPWRVCFLLRKLRKSIRDNDIKTLDMEALAFGGKSYIKKKVFLEKTYSNKFLGLLERSKSSRNKKITKCDELIEWCVLQTPPLIDEKMAGSLENHNGEKMNDFLKVPPNYLVMRVTAHGDELADFGGTFLCFLEKNKILSGGVAFAMGLISQPKLIELWNWFTSM